jgi:CspA family cold shock protein
VPLPYSQRATSLRVTRTGTRRRVHPVGRVRSIESARAPTRTRQEKAVPTGTVKWYDSEKGFGFVTADDGEDVFVHVSTLPAGVAALRPGSRVEFGVVDGRRGKQALSVKILETPSVAKGVRKPADDMAIILEDLIKLLDGVSGQLRRGKYPSDEMARKAAAVLRAVADDLDI